MLHNEKIRELGGYEKTKRGENTNSEIKETYNEKRNNDFKRKKQEIYTALIHKRRRLRKIQNEGTGREHKFRNTQNER